MEINYENVNKLTKAFQITDEVFQERKYGANMVDVGNYLLTGNTLVFTSTNGAREMVESLDLEDLTVDVKATLINSAINTIGLPHHVRATVNRIPDLIIEFAKNKKDNPELDYNFNYIYDTILRNPKYSQWIGMSLVGTNARYNEVLNRIETGMISEEVIKIIGILEETKTSVLEERNKGRQ